VIAFQPGPSSLVVASTADVTALREALARALTERHYELESESGQHMVAHTRRGT
jgi:hypothetical protein